MTRGVTYNSRSHGTYISGRTGPTLRVIRHLHSGLHGNSEPTLLQYSYHPLSSFLNIIFLKRYPAVNTSLILYRYLSTSLLFTKIVITFTFRKSHTTPLVILKLVLCGCALLGTMYNKLLVKRWLSVVKRKRLLTAVAT